MRSCAVSRMGERGLNDVVTDNNGILQGQLCDVEPSQDDGRSPAVLRHPGPREGRVEEEQQGNGNLTKASVHTDVCC